LSDLLEGGNIDLCVVRGRIRRLVPQDGSDLIQCGARTQHHGCGTVPKEIRTVGWWILDTSAPKSSANDAGNDRSRAEGTEWRLYTEKHAVDGDLWACMFYVVQNRVSCILW
jgi:hypothetical protein